MENASKALIIAGAILISILLISVGIIIMNAINDPVSQAGSSAESQAIETFNSKFTAYEGTEVKGSTVKSLISTINSSNGVEATNKVLFNDKDAPTISDIPDYSPNNTYSVVMTYDGTKGRIKTITCSKN